MSRSIDKPYDVSLTTVKGDANTLEAHRGRPLLVQILRYYG